MEILTAILMWSLLWMFMLWRIAASYNIYKEILSGDTTGDAVFFAFSQGIIFLFISIIYGRKIGIHCGQLITEFLFIVTGAANIFFGIKSTMVIKKRKKVEQTN